MSASRPTMSSSRFATSSGAAIKRATGSSPRCGRSFIRWKTRSRPWGSRYGRWSSWRPTMHWRQPPPLRPRTSGSTRYASGRRIKTLHSACAAIVWSRWTGVGKAIRDADGVHKKFGVYPELIPDYLALVGDNADGYPGIAGIGPKGAAEPGVALRRDREISRGSSGRAARTRAAVQEAGHIEDGCKAIRRCGGARVARSRREFSKPGRAAR